jgi:hypothetical protein
METTVLVKAIRQVCLAQNSAAPDRRHARTGHPATLPDAPAIFPGLLAKLLERPANLPDRLAISPDILAKHTDVLAISPDGPAKHTDDLAILPEDLAILTDLPAILPDLLAKHTDVPEPGQKPPNLPPKHPYNSLNVN